MNSLVNQSKDLFEDTKKYIIDTARQLFSEHSYLGVSMSDIAQKLNITKAALYYHFTGKAEIYKTVLDEVFSNFKTAINDAYNETELNQKLHKLIKNYLDFGEKEKNLIKALFADISPREKEIRELIIKLRQQIQKSIQPLIETILIAKNLTNQVDFRLLTSLLTCMMDGVILEYSYCNKKIESNKIADQIILSLFPHV